MYKNKFLMFMILCLLVLTGCSIKIEPQPGTPDNPDVDVEPQPDTDLDSQPVINNVSFNGMNNDITKLEGSFDNIKSLQEMTNVNYNDSIYTKTSISSKSNFSDMVRLSLENEDEENNVVDYTNPSDWYYEQAASVTSSYYDFKNFFNVIESFYNEAKLKKNEILKSENLEYLNVWYKDGDYTNRVTYNEELNDLICESIFENKIYAKLNIGRNSEGKLYYSYIKTEFTDEPNIKNGLKYYGSIEYLEDSYYNSYETVRGECSVRSENNITYFYQYSIKCYEVDLTVEGGMYYSLLDCEYYEKESCKRYDWIAERILEDGEEISEDLGVFYCYWIENGNLVEYRFKEDFKGLLMLDKNGYLVFDITFSTEHLYSAYLNLYEMSGVKQILGEFKGKIWPDFTVEFENGEIVVTNDSFYREVSCIPWGTSEEVYPCLELLRLESIENLSLKLQTYDIDFISFDFEKMIEIFNNPLIKINGYLCSCENTKILKEYFMTQIKIINFEEINQEYKNFEEMKLPVNINIAIQTEGLAKIKGDYIDLSEIKIDVNLNDSLDEENIKKIDLYYNGVKVSKLDFEYEDGIFTFGNVEKVKFEQNKYDRLEEYKLTIKFVKTGVVIEIPYIIE